MRMTRNITFVILMGLASFASTLPAQADGYECLPNCWCEFTYGGPCAVPSYSITCSGVVDCDETYPDWCSVNMQNCSQWCDSFDTYPAMMYCEGGTGCSKSCQCWPLIC